MTCKHKFFSGNLAHADKNRIYVANRREMIHWLLDGKLHCLLWTNQAQWVGEATLAGEGRVKTLADAKKLYCDIDGIYRLE